MTQQGRVPCPHYWQEDVRDDLALYHGQTAGCRHVSSDAVSFCGGNLRACPSSRVRAEAAVQEKGANER